MSRMIDVESTGILRNVWDEARQAETLHSCSQDHLT